MLIWQTSDKTNRRQRLISISASSRLSGDANGRRELRRNEWLTCCTMPPSTMRYVSLFKSQNLLHWCTRLVIEKAKAHEHNVLEYKDHQASHGGANSAPSYNNLLLTAHALTKRWPSGRGNNGHHCGKCGKSHEARELLRVWEDLR